MNWTMFNYKFWIINPLLSVSQGHRYNLTQKSIYFSQSLKTGSLENLNLSRNSKHGYIQSQTNNTKDF